MKTFLRSVVLTAVIAVSSTAAFAQQSGLTTKSVSKLVSDKGYWVIEKNVKTPKTATVHFYTNDNALMYSEQVQGVKLDAKKRKTVNLLNQALLKTLFAWQKEKMQKQNEQLVSNILSSKKD